MFRQQDEQHMMSREDRQKFASMFPRQDAPPMMSPESRKNVDANLAEMQQAIGDLIRSRMSALGTANVCVACKRNTQEADGQPVHLRCAQCKTAYYCSEACQKKDWTLNHKRECLKILHGRKTREQDKQRGKGKKEKAKNRKLLSKMSV